MFPSVFSPRPLTACFLPILRQQRVAKNRPAWGPKVRTFSDFLTHCFSAPAGSKRADLSPFCPPNVELKSTKPGNETVLSFSSGPLNVALESLGREAKRAANPASERKLLMISIEVAAAQSEPACGLFDAD